MPDTDEVTPMSPFARRMQKARLSSGLRLDEASVEARRILGATYGPSRETIRRYEVGLITEERADPLVVTALAEIYGVNVGELSWPLAQQAKSIHKLMGRHLRREGYEALKDEPEEEPIRTP